MTMDDLASETSVDEVLWRQAVLSGKPECAS